MKVEVKQEDLKEGWVWCSIADLNLRQSGNVDPIKHPNETFELYSVPSLLTGEPEVLKGIEIGSTKSVVKEGEVLLCKINPRINRVWIVGSKGEHRQIASSEWIIIDALDFIDSKYLMYLFSESSFRKLLNSELSGVGGSLTRARPKLVDKYKVRIAPLAEQKRIVAKLDAVMEEVDAAREKLDSFPETIKKFRQSVLAQAVTGKFSNNYSAWLESTIQENYIFIGSGVTPRGGQSAYKNSGIPFIRSMNVYPNDLRLNDITFIDEKQHQKMSRSKLKDKDVLLNITGASIGRSTIVPVGFGEGNVNQHVCIIRTKPTLLPEFLALYLNSLVGQEYIMAKQNGMTRQGLNYSQIKAMPIPIPPLEEQKEIVKKVEALFAYADQLEEAYERVKESVDQLPQSILAKAFRGELVPQDPNDEPASVLLERIKEERAKPKAKKEKKAKAEQMSFV
jgi:type I restriction enzyme, S subunit